MAVSSATPLNFAAPEFIANPFPQLARLRESDPVHWHAPTRSWCLTRYADLTAVYRDSRFSAERIRNFVSDHGDKNPDLELLGECVGLWMVFNDPPTHTRLRKLTQQAFNRKSLEKMRPVIERQVDELLDGFGDAGEVDFVERLAWPLPANVIADLLGVPREHVDDLKRWSDDLGQFVLTSRINEQKYSVAAAALTQMNTLFADIINHKRAHPGDDVIDTLIAASDGTDVLSAQELVAFCVLLLFAGHETTAHFLASGLRALVQHPDQMQQMRSNIDDSSFVTNACNEMLRYDGPIVAISRHVNETLEFQNAQLNDGDRVYLFHAAANRDPDVFERPDAFDVTRPDAAKMIGFGYGIHLCLGIHLARLEGEVAFPLILKRLKNIALTGPEPQWTDTLVIRGPKTLTISGTW